MKKLIVLLTLLLIPSFVYAYQIGEFYKDINISVNCSKCDPTDEPEVTFQLFAEGEEVENAKLVLNKDNEYKGTFEHLAVFKENTFDEINYEVKYLEDGTYRSLKPEEISYKKKKESKWVQVLAEDLKPGHDYVLLTDNWYHEYNDRDPLILLDGDLYHQYVEVIPDYNIINGKKSYYSLVTEPNEKTIWHFEKLPETDELYNIYEGYWQLTNYNDQKLVLSGYMGNGSNSYFYKVSNNNGLAEGKTYANRVAITPIEEEAGRFKISSQAYWSADHQTTLYLGIGHSVEAKAQREPEYAAHFIAFEYLENVEVEQVFDVQIDKVLCSELENVQENPLTSNHKIYVAIVLLLASLMAILFVYTKRDVLLLK